jgi:uncharacterized protein (DUF362 family)
MSIIESLLRDVALPRMVAVRQIFPEDGLTDVATALRTELRAPQISARIRPGARIAIAVGSRGLADLPLLVSVVVDELKERGAAPFIVPAMGSHGGATAEGQKAVLAALGVTEASAGCPIVSSMETVELGTLDNGLPILMDRHAMEADGIVVINRVKPHTSFSGPSESGLVKMITIGLGKQKGADSCHALGFGQMAKNIVDMARIKLRDTPILFGVATVENAYEKIARVAAVPAEEIVEREVELLREAKQKMPRILFNPLDVLVVDRMGKEYSGTGMDPNITGRAATPYVETSQRVSKMVVLDLTDKTKGNAAGMGFADLCTRRLFDRIDFEATYANHITSTVLTHARIPVIMESDRLAVQAAVKTCNVTDPRRLRLVRIPNTLHLEHIRISEAMLDEALQSPGISVVGEPMPWSFDSHGNLSDIGH